MSRKNNHLAMNLTAGMSGVGVRKATTDSENYQKAKDCPRYVRMYMLRECFGPLSRRSTGSRPSPDHRHQTIRWPSGSLCGRFPVRNFPTGIKRVKKSSTRELLVSPRVYMCSLGVNMSYKYTYMISYMYVSVCVQRFE